MARDELAPKSADGVAARRPVERPAPAFGPLRGGVMIQWKVQERRS